MKKDSFEVMRLEEVYLDKVSVIIPCYNAEKYIAQTIESVLRQTHRNFEIMVIDDCSVDNTLGVLTEYVEKGLISVLTLQSNFGGPARPRNLGISKATGKWVAFLDADDIWNPSKLEEQLRVQQSTGASFLCTGKRDFVKNNDVVFWPVHSSRFWTIKYNMLLLKDFIPTSSVLIERAILKMHLFDERKSLISVEDYELWLRILRSGTRCIKMSHDLVHYRISKEQISRKKWKRIRIFINMFKIHFNASDVSAKILLALFFTFTHYAITLFLKIWKRFLPEFIKKLYYK